MDIAEEQLSRTRASRGRFSRSLVTAPWGFAHPGTMQLALHVVVRGTAWITREGEPATTMRAGDVALLPAGTAYRFADSAATATPPYEEFLRLRSESPETPDALAPDTTEFFCGAYQFSGDVTRGLLAALPPLLIIPAGSNAELSEVIAQMSSEFAAERVGKHTVLSRLLDVAVIHAIRHAVELAQAPTNHTMASVDALISPAIHKIHADPAHPWTVDELAAACQTTRSSFLRAFREVTQQTPFEYLTEWRMTVARDLLLSDVSIEEIAVRIGYSTPYAFTAAFSRHQGMPPRRWAKTQSL